MKKLLVASIVSLFTFSGCFVRKPVRTAAKPSERAVSPEPEKAVAKELHTKLVPLRPSTSGALVEAPVRGKAIYKLLNFVGSHECDKAEELWFCANDRWFVGENRRAKLVHPNPKTKSIIKGADLGISVIFGPERRTYFYMGDTMGKWSRQRCSIKAPNTVCNDAILVTAGPQDETLPVVQDPEKGVPAAVVVEHDSRGRELGFAPLIIDGINGRNPLPFCNGLKKDDFSPCLAPFNVPSGAVTVSLPKKSLSLERDATQEKVEAILLFYTTAATLFVESKNRSRGASFLVVSTDGVQFEKLQQKPFSRDKFIEVAPVLVPEQTRENLCQRTPQSPLCNQALGAKGDLVLLFGTGEKYRESPVYLGVMRLADFRVLYYHFDSQTGIESWVDEEGRASPIIGKRLNRSLAAKVLTKRVSTEVFGELSAKLVPADACPASSRSVCEDTIVLLSNQATAIHYRTAPLAYPGSKMGQQKKSAWSKPRRTSAVGYGPYIMDAYTSIQPGPQGMELKMYHVVSAWDGRKLKNPKRNPYGVFTRRLMLVDESSCDATIRELPKCKHRAPPWPP